VTATITLRKAPRFSRPGRIHGRLVGFLLVFVLLFGAIVVRVGMVQTTDAATFVSEGEHQRIHSIELPAGRGTIFDRSGVEMALTVPASTILADPRLMKDKNEALVQLMSVLHLDNKQAQELANKMNSNTEFAYVRRQVDDDVADEVRAMKIPGIYVVAESRRLTPADDLAVSLIGATDLDGKGTGGLEKQYDSVLTGKKGSVERETDQQGNSIPNGQNITIPATPGDDLVLTLDSRLQFITDRLLAQQVTAAGAKGGIVIVLDTATGDVLAMSNIRVDPVTHKPLVSTSNHALVDAYEPGSVAKIISASAALEEGTSDLAKTWDIPKSIVGQKGNPSIGYKVDDRIVTDAEDHNARAMTLPDIIAHSSNIGTVKLAQSVGAGKIDEYFRAFGFGAVSGLGFPNETAGILPRVDKTSKAQRATISYGQGIGVTAIQLAGAMNTIANGGTYVAPRLVRATIDTVGTEHAAEPAATRRVIRPDTAAQMISVLEGVVCFGTASVEDAAKIPGYAVAGKTGTAFKAQNVKGEADGYKDKLGQYHYVASFAGFVPAEAPKVTVLVSIDEPSIGDYKYGRKGAAPLFAEVAAEALRSMKVPPSPAGSICPTTAK
jgi:cell division protein FtsI (penicillin-binding protein 3)